MKPDWCDETTWNAACDAVAEVRGASDLSSIFEDEAIDIVARALIAARNEGMVKAATLIDEGFERPGIETKYDTCAHFKYGWEDCEQCAAAAIRSRIQEEG